MPKRIGDDRRNFSQKPNAPLTPMESDTPDSGADSMDKTQLNIPVQRETRRMPEPTHSKSKRERASRERTVHPRAHSIFKTRTKNPNFVLSVATTTLRLSFVLALCTALALLGAVVGIAKAFVDTAPTLDLAALDAQDKTSFIYDSNGNLITDYKGTEDRIMVSIDEIPDMLQNAFIAVEDARFTSITASMSSASSARWSPTLPAVRRRAARPSPSS